MKLSLDILKEGNVVVFKGDNSLICRLIKKAQRRAHFMREDAEYTHVAIVGPKWFIIDVAMPRTKVIDMRDKYKGRYIKVLEYKADNYEDVRKEIAFWSATKNNLTYDKWGVIKFRIKFLFHKLNQYFCSENCTYAFQKLYPKFLNGTLPHKTMPADYLGLIFRTKWEGVL